MHTYRVSAKAVLPSVTTEELFWHYRAQDEYGSLIFEF
uniref:Uncharacterized protein n=1 Tax=Siphoviridae sp. ctP6113 TaxID=2826318 RepID=A0A8S5MUA8_9CAUD|nr:MAG TPA: hypothetical protein [Siphoviridae sp. ctP6113]